MMLSWAVAMEMTHMPQVLIRDVRPIVLERLKARAQAKGHSLQAELTELLEGAAGMTMEEARRESARLRDELKGRKLYTAADHIRYDRDYEH
jgi:hypothetical protein